MAKTKISEYDATAANNTDIDSINIAEGMAPSNVNNAIRELMAHLKDMNIGSTITMLNTTEEDGDGGRVNKIIFKGEQSGGEESVLGEIQVSHDGTADDQKGDLIFKTNDGADGASPTEAMRIDSSQNIITSNTVDINTASRALPVLKFTHTNSGFDNFQIGGGTPGVSNAGFTIRDVDASANRLVIDTSGNVGIGVSPSQKLHVEGAGNQFIFLNNSTTNDGFFFKAGAGASSLQTNSGSHIMNFFTGGTERMRIDSDGRVMFSEMVYNSYPTNNSSIKIGRGTDVNMIVVGYGGGHTVVQFKHGGDSVVGSIHTSATATTYNTSSDYRLKENVANISDGITRVKQLSPKRFNFIVDADKTVDGFLAHEAATVVPEAVTGTKDGLEVWTEKEKDELPEGVSVGDNKLDDGGNTIPLMQGIDQAKLVPLLTAALQEAIAKIEALETRVATLEG